MIYQPLEDSFLLEEQVKQFARGSVLDMGTGTGIQAAAAAKKRDVREVIALDIQKDAVEFCLRNVKDRKIMFFASDLFDFLRTSKKYRNKKFDTIIFNPPYLPSEPRLKDLTVDGGKRGFEIVGRFLKDAGGYLKDDGILLLLISSLTNKPRIEKMLTELLFEFRITAKKHIFFEDLFVYLIQKNRITQKLAKKGVKNLEYFTKGHRGILFTGKYKGRKITIKAKLPESKAVGRIANEARWLKLLNRHGIGPKIVMSNKDFFAYIFAEGDFISDFIENSTKKQVKNALKEIFRQCHQIDVLGIDKEEMHRPFKHILIKNSKVVMIDFERAHRSKKPKNVTQFCQFIGSGYIEMLLERKRIDINRKTLIRLAKEYKKSKDIQPILKMIQAQ